MSLTGKVRWTRFNYENVAEQVEAVALEALKELKPVLWDVLEKNVGTQYASLAELRQMGHPYRIGGSGRPKGIPRGVVNRQSGEFFSGFKIHGPQRRGRYVSISVVVADSEKGKKLEHGDPEHNMQGRPWQEHLQAQMRKAVGPAIRRLERTLRIRVKI